MHRLSLAVPQSAGRPYMPALLPAEESSARTYALKRMRKSAVVQCPEHVFCEQAITRNTAHPFCIRQYASFQVGPITRSLCVQTSPPPLLAQTCKKGSAGSPACLSCCVTHACLRGQPHEAGVLHGAM